MVSVDRYNGRLAPKGCGRALSLPFDADALPSQTSDCGAAPPPEPSAEDKPPPPPPKEEKKSKEGGFGGFLRDFLGN